MQTNPIGIDFSHAGFHVGAVRSPIQCEGIERGHRRIAEVAASGAAVGPNDWKQIVGGIAQALPQILSWF